MARKNQRKPKNTKGKRQTNERHRQRKSIELVGVMQMTKDGFGFVTVQEQEDDIYVKASKMGGALNGDLVKVVILKEKTLKTRREGKVSEIIERSKRPFVGVLHIASGQAWVIMQSRVMPYDIQITNLQSFPDAVPGMKVSAVVDYWKKSDSCPSGHIVDVLGMAGENDTEMHAILAEFGLPYNFDAVVEKEADEISEEITEEEIAKRRDFRDVLTFTIDPKDAKDFDDALSFRVLENGNYEVGVHIADVTHYVKPGTLIDEEAVQRATSVYLVDRTIPMLPEKLSNKLCSLRPNETKLTFSAVFEMTPLGRIADQWFGRTVIHSNHRFTYEEAQKIIEDGAKSDFQPADIKEAVLQLHSLASKLRKKRFSTGAIGFERPEMKVEIDEKGRPINIYQKITKEANWLVEEFMLLANRCVAEYVARNLKKGKEAKTFVYRIHDEPNQEKLENLRHFVGNFGYKMGSTNTGKEISKALNGLFEEAKDKPEFNAIELLSLRTMAKAKYDVDNIGHYGLAFKYYTHFTSPIRRYPDMMVHRLLARYLAGGESAKRDLFERLCKHSSEREVVAADAERASIKYKLVEFMQDKIGYEYDGHISGLTEWGIYVEIEPTKIEGMVALRDIQSDYFEFDEENYRLVGKHSKKVYNLGDPVRIKVKRTNLDHKQLDFEIV